MATVKEVLEDLLDRVLDAVSHTLVTAVAIVSVFCVHWLLQKLFGPEPRFFERLPLRWVIDAGCLTLLLRLLLHYILLSWKALVAAWRLP